MSKEPSLNNLALALVHYPVYNKHRETVTTAVTNLDIHDIARAARTYGVLRYYLVTPSQDQQDNRPLEGWLGGSIQPRPLRGSGDYPYRINPAGCMLRFPDRV